MKKHGSTPEPDAMRAEYDFSGCVRGKYAEHYRKGTNVVLLDPEFAGAFPDSESVNAAFHALLDIAKWSGRRKRK